MTTDRIALSIDLEWFQHTPAYRGADETADDTAIGKRGVEFLLDVLEDHDVEATFFVVSEIAESHPELLRRIANDGHEIGSHTQSHRLLTELDADERRSELASSRATLARVTDRRVVGFRAPAFDLPEGYFRELNDAGYTYDSSVVPSRSIPGWYGGEHDTRRPCSARHIDRSAPRDLSVVPLAVTPRLELPASGAWARLLGRRYLHYGIRSLQTRDVTPVLYFHPWELVELPRLDGVPRRVYWRTGGWLRQTLRSLVDLPTTFTTVGRLVDQVDA